ncbi:adenylate/guanylate cyclase domain-containing protein [Aestuariirhabdus sp. Z084]|uniref:adenylate/guanylate cyclase domain-containing protein n=1 Tax=Aestuariirhabdus haliotis TaxID=2918751 RepID=UPI00201B36D8|nr:adenylate/guanylate cyclase domain-containing protein [Aestuariirhabdus haliotis]MCL6414822.1 adenylate/guanylate cyclase domain-containing protein [Aestuariirhabdus haliotis]MCL6418754.1 adenylate/guanylate cyclase domain-containing protein [Aestuariirhabdus haliotis]
MNVQPIHVPEEPLSQWMLNEAWRLPDAQSLTKALVERLLSLGVPLYRVRITLRLLHPQITGFSFTWVKGDDEITVYNPPHEMLHSETYRDSPYWAIFEEGAGAIRRRLSGPDAQLDYPLLSELADEGASDYVALPIEFMDGSIHAITLAADKGPGFSTEHLAMIYELLPAMGRVLEIYALRCTSQILLETYLGKRTGSQVLQGRIKRGDGEQIEAIIWFCDLRGSTQMADQMGLEAFIEKLNQFFEIMAQSVLEQDGEVLRYIGDAMLAIFPIGKHGCEAVPAKVAANALMAARCAISRMQSEPECKGMEFGIGLHFGTVMYGNIGSPSRLEFTAIGAAANEAARIQDLTKSLGVPLLASHQFVEKHGGQGEDGWRFNGSFPLRGVSGERRVYTPHQQQCDSNN